MDLARQELDEEPPICTEQPGASLCQNEQTQDGTYRICVPTQDPQRFYPQVIPASTLQRSPDGQLASAINGQQAQKIIVLTQPGKYFPREIDNTLPPNYLNLSILSAYCFFPLGLPAIFMSYKVDAAVRRGDVDAARKTSDIAKILALCGIATGCAILALIILPYMLFNY